MNMKKSCCFTGHRPEKLGVPAEIVIRELKEAIDESISNGFHTFITGMAQGVDIWAAEYVLQVKKNHPELKLICAVPYAGFEKSWEITWKEKYNHVIEEADEVHYISEHYHRGAFQLRNIWMVDHSTKIIAGFTGASGGTKNTLNYAKRNGNVEIHLLNLN